MRARPVLSEPPRAVGFHETHLRGAAFQRYTSPYSLWMAQRTLDAFRALAPAERAAGAGGARRHGLRGAAGLRAPPPRRQAPLQARPRELSEAAVDTQRPRPDRSLGRRGRLADDSEHALFRRQPARVVHQPRALVAPVQPARPRGGAEREQSAARAGALPRHRRFESLGVLRGARREPAPAGRGRHHQAHAGRHDARRAARGDRRGGARADGRALPLLEPRAAPGAREGGHRLRRARGARAGAAGLAARSLRARDLPGADADRPRPGPSVSRSSRAGA